MPYITSPIICGLCNTHLHPPDISGKIYYWHGDGKGCVNYNKEYSVNWDTKEVKEVKEVMK